METLLQYFQTAISLARTLRDVQNLLEAPNPWDGESAGKIGGLYLSIAEIKRRITQVYPYNVIVNWAQVSEPTIFKGKSTREDWLKSINFCFNLTLHPIRCTTPQPYPEPGAMVKIPTLSDIQKFPTPQKPNAPRPRDPSPPRSGPKPGKARIPRSEKQYRKHSWKYS